MADITITCEKCGNVVTVSEFVDPNSISCRSCGEKMRKPHAEVPKSKSDAPRKLGIKPRADLPPVIEEPVQDEDPKKKRRREKKQAKEKVEGVAVTQHLWAWALFIVLALITGTLRYGNLAFEALDPYCQPFIALSEQFALLAVGALTILVLLKAFQDSMFHGILSLLVPGYAIYYVIALSDDFFLRATFCGVLAGLGQDAGLQFYQIAAEVIPAVDAVLPDL